jgi:CheY-specific phosphatase CheX
MTQVYDKLREILEAKAVELFGAYGVACAPVADPPRAARQLCGILGFTGERLCGSVIVAASEAAIAESNPLADGATRAWTAELTNQLVGRFKNELFRRGAEVAMSIPVVLTATQLMPLPQAQVVPVELAVGTGVVALWLEIEAQPDLFLVEPAEATEVAAEGEAMMF